MKIYEHWFKRTIKLISFYSRESATVLKYKELANIENWMKDNLTGQYLKLCLDIYNLEKTIHQNFYQREIDVWRLTQAKSKKIEAYHQVMSKGGIKALLQHPLVSKAQLNINAIYDWSVLNYDSDYDITNINPIEDYTTSILVKPSIIPEYRLDEICLNGFDHIVLNSIDAKEMVWGQVIDQVTEGEYDNDIEDKLITFLMRGILYYEIFELKSA